MAALLTADQIREHIETGLADDALERLINDADAEIIRRLGPAITETEVLAGGERFLHISRKATAIVSAVERVYLDIGGGTNYALAADDYSLLSDGYRVERLSSGTNQASYWRGQVTIVSTPVDESAQRIRLEIDLVRLAVNYSATKSESIGDVSMTPVEYQAERNRLIDGLASQGRRLLF